MTPSTLTQAVIYLVALVPGIVYRAIRIRATGVLHSDQSAGQRATTAIVTSALFAASYLYLTAPQVAKMVSGGFSEATSRTVGGYVLIGAFVVPLLSGYAVNAASSLGTALAEEAFAERDIPSGSKYPVWVRFSRWFLTNVVGRHAQKTPWDRQLHQLGDTWVRIRKSDGVFLMGFMDSRAYLSSHPDPPSIYLGLQAKVDGTGKHIKNVEKSRGFWYMLAPGDFVEFMEQEQAIDREVADEEGVEEK